MSNISKAIAVLGVVAGLGVAALPLSSYAVTTPVEWKDDGAGGSSYGTDADGKKWVAKPVGVQLKIEEGLQISTSNEDGKNVEMSKDSAGDEYTSKGFAVTVIANNNAGYVLSIKGSSATAGEETILKNDANAANTIVAMPSASFSALSLNAGKSAWGWGLATTTDSGTQEADTFKGVTTGYDVVKAAQSKATANTGDVTPITFGAKIADGQAAGTYTGQVTFMATAGAAAANPTN